jgi:carbonic anhydrase
LHSPGKIPKLSAALKKLIRGIIEFRKTRRPEYASTFAKLAQGQFPDALFIACSDSRVVPNLFASTEPGDLFVVRNVGNIMPPCGPDGVSMSDESEAAAIELAVLNLKVKDIIVCGHSDCAAMRTLHSGLSDALPPHLHRWLRHAEAARTRYENGARTSAELAPHNQISQLNALLQLEHLRAYPAVRQAESEGRLALHAWWFDIGHADVHYWKSSESRFVLIDESCL